MPVEVRFPWLYEFSPIRGNELKIGNFLGQIADAARVVAVSCYNINKCTRGTELVFNESMKKVR